MRVCSQSAFGEDQTYPAFNLDMAYKGLFLLSRELLAEAGQTDMEKAYLLVSVSRALSTPVQQLISADPR